MKFVEARKILFNKLNDDKFIKNSKNEMIRQINNGFQIINFQKSSYSEAFYISLGLYIDSIHEKTLSKIEYYDCDLYQKQIIGPVNSDFLNDEKIGDIHNQIKTKLNDDFTSLDEIIDKFNSKYYEEILFFFSSDLDEFLGKYSDISKI